MTPIKIVVNKWSIDLLISVSVSYVTLWLSNYNKHKDRVNELIIKKNKQKDA